LLKYAVGGEASDVFILEQDLSFVRAVETCEKVEDGGLSRSVGANKAGDRLGADREGTPIDCPQASEGLRQIIYNEHTHHPANKKNRKPFGFRFACLATPNRRY
jgi:hypothetical protein